MKKNIKFKDNKGNWEFNFNQKYYDPNLEAKIKLSMKPFNNIDFKNINQYINPELSREELLLNKYNNNNNNLKSSEKIIVNNYLKKKEENINNDIKNIKLYGLSAKPITNEGKIRLLFETLKYQLIKNNNDLVVNIYLKLLDYKNDITEQIKTEYEIEYKQMYEIINKTDIIELQFTKFYSQMPPLNIKGFNKLDEWQIKVINNIDNNLSTLINTPTSAGKSVLSGYVTTKGKALFIVPTDALAWQMSAYIGNIIGNNVPILTTSFQSIPYFYKMIELINNSSFLVATPDIYLNYLPYIKVNYNWIIYDEIHMISKSKGSSMEHLLKIYNDIPSLLLSATIGNTDEILIWLNSINQNKKFDKIECNKRYFNFNNYYYNNTTNELNIIHPLSLINEDDIKNKTILNKNLQLTPVNIWDLAIKLKNNYNLNDLDPYIYFNKELRIELDQVNIYLHKLLNFIILEYENNKDKIMNIINLYKNINLETSNINLINLAFKLKESKKTPIILFHQNTTICTKIGKLFFDELEKLENLKYPNLFNERLKLEKIFKKYDKKNDKKDNIKQINKQQKEFLSSNDDNIILDSFQEPHIDFILNDIQYFNESEVESWVEQLKIYFPNNGDYYHYIIRLLWRGIGIYTEDLPEIYLRLVQSLAFQKKLAIVISDISLVFGISMPFKSVVVYNDINFNDNLNSLIYHQMIGRAGRRGLDKEGNVILAGFSWDRIKELCISEYPKIIGKEHKINCINYVNELSKINNNNINWNNMCSNFLNTNSSFFNFHNNNNLICNDELLLCMNWKLRYDTDFIIITILLPYLNKAFNNKHPNEINNQIEIAHFLLYFINCNNTDNNNILLKPDILFNSPFNNIETELINNNIILPKNKDNSIFLCIQNNNINKNLSLEKINYIKYNLKNVGYKIKIIQHYCYHTKKMLTLTKLLAKLLTRIWWINHNSLY